MIDGWRDDGWREGGGREGLSASELPAQEVSMDNGPASCQPLPPIQNVCHNKSACVFIPSSLKPRH